MLKVKGLNFRKTDYSPQLVQLNVRWDRAFGGCMLA